MSYSSLVEAFEALEERRLRWPGGLDERERESWRQMRSRIEEVLFQQASPSGADRRRHLRAPVRMQARYWSQDELTDRYISTLSEGGLFISTVEPLPLGTRIELEIMLTRDDYSLRVQGEVVSVVRADPHAERCGMGVKFIDLDYEQKLVIYQLVRDVVRQSLLERRRHSRLGCMLPAQLVFDDGYIDLVTYDLSPSGIFVPSDVLFDEGQEIQLRLDVPMAGEVQALRLDARVARVVSEPEPGLMAGIGLGFVEPDPIAAQRIRDYMVACALAEIAPPYRAEEMLGRRSHPRLQRRIPIRYRFDDMPTIPTYSRDISCGGVFIQTHDAPPSGEPIEVQIHHPMDPEQIALVGRVIRVVKPDPEAPHLLPGAGVKFGDLSPAEIEKLRQFIRQFVL
ncbi:MAG: PilZ domain-containing protein [Deltaproteobacteria bacterium]|nr:PilZ domain-containing protein [Deltaproteobacteria bacterium]